MDKTLMPKLNMRELMGNMYRKMRWNFFWKNFQIPVIHQSNLFPTLLITEPVFREKLCLPPYEQPDDHDDAAPLFSLAQFLNPETILELGTAHGATVANLCAVTSAKIYTVNALPEQISGTLTTYALTQEEIGFVYRKYGFENRVVQIYENTRDLIITKYIPVHSIDLAIIDACHDTDFVVNDFLKVLPVLHDKSVVLFHDVHPSMRHHLKDGYIACMYLRRRGYDIKHVQGTWWAVLRMGDAMLNSSLSQKAFVALENLITSLRGDDASRDAFYMRWLASIFLPKSN